MASSMCGTRRAGRGAALTALGVLGGAEVAPSSEAAVTSAGPGETTAPSAPASRVPEPIAAAMAWRRAVGLPAYETYVRALAEDIGALRHAQDAGFPYPLTEAELAALLQRSHDMTEISKVALAYAATLPDEFAGAYVDPEHSRYVFLVTANVERHREELFARLPPGTPVVVAQVRWSLAELEPIAERIRQDDAFFEALGAFAATNIVEPDNIVEVELHSDDPTDAGRIHARYGDDPRIRVRIAGRGPWAGGRGNVLVRLVDRDGRPVSPDDAVCVIVADDERAWSSDESDRAVVDGGCEFRRVGATRVEVQIREETAAGRVIGRERGVVPVNDTVTITVVVGEGE